MSSKLFPRDLAITSPVSNQKPLKPPVADENWRRSLLGKKLNEGGSEGRIQQDPPEYQQQREARCRAEVALPIRELVECRLGEHVLWIIWGRLTHQLLALSCPLVGLVTLIFVCHILKEMVFCFNNKCYLVIFNISPFYMNTYFSRWAGTIYCCIFGYIYVYYVCF